MKRKTVIILISYMAAAIAVAAGFAAGAKSEAAQLRRTNDAVYQRAFSELVTNVGEIDSSLQKSLYATSPAVASAVYTNVFGKAQAAQMSLGELPFSGILLERTSGFLSSVGDYSYMLSREASAGRARSDEQYGNLLALSDAASMLSSCLIDLQSQVNDGVITIGELKNSEEELSKLQSEISTLGEGFSMIETDFPEIPSLIYDGPFSQHIQAMKPRLLEGMSDISAEDALQKAVQFTGIDSLALFCQREGNLPVYCFSAETEKGTVSVDVTKAGGEILGIYSSCAEGERVIAPEDAVLAARAYLEERGYEAMKESYWSISGGSALVNFAYVQNNVICYPDLIKVAVSLSSGEVCGFEALGYIMNHTSRNIPQSVVSEADAAGKVPDSLTRLSHSLAVIPTTGKYEVLCHEFKCQNSSEQHYIVYVNAESGEQEKILLLIEDDSGTLTL